MVAGVGGEGRRHRPKYSVPSAPTFPGGGALPGEMPPTVTPDIRARRSASRCWSQTLRVWASEHH